MQFNQQNHLRKDRVSIDGRAYAITKCQNKNYHTTLTEHSEFANQLINSFLFCQKQQWFNLAAFVIMPDHFHLLFQLEKSKSLPEVIHSIDSYTAKLAKKIFQNEESQLWQKGYYDHCIRSDESLIVQIRYIEANPMRAQLVDEERLWPYSSAHDNWKESVNRSWIW